MAILFFGGIMNLYWIMGLALPVLFEKALPVGQTVSYLTGAVLAVWGASFIYTALV
jgi:predicted metal-binding membrane protein